MTTVRVMPGPLKEFCREVFQKAGAVSGDAAILADTLIEANLRGVDTHGVIRLKIYSTRIEKRILNTDPTAITIISESPVSCHIDGADSAGQVLGVMAMEKAIAIAKDSGIGVVLVRNANNFGTAAYYAMKALNHDMIGICCAETGPNLAPYGGAEGALGNNPISIAVPAEHFPPVVLDMAMSVAAGGKVRKSAKEGRPIPEGWIINSDGLPTTDPYDYIDPERKGCLIPFAGHKGSGLAVMVSLLAGVLSSSVFGKQVGPAFSLEVPAHQGQLYAAIRINLFCDPDEYKRRVDQAIQLLKDSKKAKGVDEIMVPGEMEFRTREERLKKGIPLSTAVLEEVKAVGVHFGVSFPELS